MTEHSTLFVAAPLSGFRRPRRVAQPEERARPRIGHVALFVAAFVATAVTALSFPAQTASDRGQTPRGPTPAVRLTPPAFTGVLK
jgi:hypothetical protein